MPSRSNGSGGHARRSNFRIILGQDGIAKVIRKLLSDHGATCTHAKQGKDQKEVSGHALNGVDLLKFVIYA